MDIIEKNVCFFCENIVNDDITKLKLPCGHNIHTECFSFYFKINKNCKICNKRIENYVIKNNKIEYYDQEKVQYVNKIFNKIFHIIGNIIFFIILSIILSLILFGILLIENLQILFYEVYICKSKIYVISTLTFFDIRILFTTILNISFILLCTVCADSKNIVLNFYSKKIIPIIIPVKNTKN